jgi:hypothetical protein
MSDGEHVITTGDNSRVTVRPAAGNPRGKIQLESTIGGSSIILELDARTANTIGDALNIESDAATT